MLTALQAKKLMKIYKTDYIKSQLKLINNYIMDAVSNDLTEVCVHGLFADGIEVILRNLGYTVEKGKDDLDYEYLRISWEEMND